MDVQMRRDLLVDLSQKAQEFLMAVLAVAFADDFARGDMQKAAKSEVMPWR